MPKRDVAKAKTARALRKLKRLADSVEQGEAKLSDWEKEFVTGVTGRLEKYGSAFRDPAKGRLEEALSQRQSQITRVLDKKARKAKPADPNNPEPEPERPRPRSTFKPKPSPPRGNVRDINDDPVPREPRSDPPRRSSFSRKS